MVGRDQVPLNSARRVIYVLVFAIADEVDGVVEEDSSVMIPDFVVAVEVDIAKVV